MHIHPKPGTLLSRGNWPKEIILYLGKSVKQGRSLGLLVYNHNGLYDGRILSFTYDEKDYPIINNSSEYLKRIKNYER